MTTLLSILLSVLVWTVTLPSEMSGHPRLLMSGEDFENLSAALEDGSNEQLNRLHTLIMRRADADPGTHVERYFDESGRRILHRSREAISRVLAGAYAYRVTGRKVYLDTVEGIINDVCGFEDWNPSHFLDVAEMCTAVGFGYDWLYDDLSEETKAKAVEAVRRLAFEPSLDHDRAWFYESFHNWNQVCNGGLTIAALAMREECDTTADRIITDAVLTNALAAEAIYSPDGNYAEGPTYWLFGTMYQALLDGCLQSALGTDFGLSDIPGFSSTADFMLYCYGANGEMFDYYDNSPRRMAAYPLWYFAWRFDRPDLLAFENEMMWEEGYDNNESDRFLPLLACWASKMPKASSEPSRGHLYVGGGATPVVIARGDWSGGPGDWYLGVKGGSPSTNHAHIDGGSFVFDSEGVRWAADPGKIEYAPVEARLALTGGDFWDLSQDSQRWDVFGMDNRWHNTITVDGLRHNVKGCAPVLEVIDDDGCKGAVVDLTELLSLDGAVRTATTDGHSLYIKDVLTSDCGASIRWTLVTEASAQIIDGGVKLSLDGKTRILSCSAPGCSYSLRASQEASERGLDLIDLDFTLLPGTTEIYTSVQ